MPPKRDPTTNRVLTRLEELARGPEQSERETFLSQTPESDVWRIRVLTLLREILPRDDLYRLKVEGLFARYRGGTFHLGDRDAVHTLKALRHDIMRGDLRPVAGLVSAQLRGDFLEQADYLFQQGYHVAAASLAGAVLEEALRQLAHSKRLSWTGPSSIAKLNALLRDSDCYSAVIAVRVGVWNTIRNKADHLETETFQGADVEEMLKGVRDFLKVHLK